jgi:hypothetical protein
MPSFEGDLLDRMRQALPVDGVYLALHGAFIAESNDDVEGDILTEVRRMVGPRVPIAVSLDIHAYVTPTMIRNSNIVVGYHYYPHDDTFETGQRSAGLLLRTLRGEIEPVLGYRRAPMLMPAQSCRTKRGKGPLADACTLARAQEAAGEVLAASYFCAQPWMDLPGNCYSAVVVGNGDVAAADRVALDMAKTAWDRRNDYLVPLVARRRPFVAAWRRQAGLSCCRNPPTTSAAGPPGTAPLCSRPFSTPAYANRRPSRSSIPRLSRQRSGPASDKSSRRGSATNAIRSMGIRSTSRSGSKNYSMGGSLMSAASWAA